MKQMGKLMLGILLVFCVIAGGSIAFADDSGDSFVTGIQNASQLETQVGQSMSSMNNDSGISEYKSAFQSASDNLAKELQVFDTITSSTDDQNVKDYIAIQKDRITSLKQVTDRIVEVCDNAQDGSTTYSNLKNSDDTIKNAISAYNSKEQETTTFLDSHSDIKDKLNQVNGLTAGFIGNDTI